MIHSARSTERKTACSGAPELVVIVAAFMLVTTLGSMAHAEDPGTEDVEIPSSPERAGPTSRRVLWILQVDAALTEKTEGAVVDIPALFAKGVASSRDENVVATGPASLVEIVSKLNRPIPGCLVGANPCASPWATAMEALDADLMVRAHLSRSGSRIEMALTLVDPTGRAAVEQTLAADASAGVGEAIEKLAFGAARDIFQATGRVVVETSPPGASILVNGLDMGRSPLTLEIPVGRAEVEVLMPNHVSETKSVSVTSGSMNTVKLELKPKVASLIVDVSPATGTVYLDNALLGETGETLEVMPGEYELEVRADGYRPRRASLTLGPEEKKVMSLSLDTVRPRLRVTRFGEVQTEAIVARRFYARAGYRFTSVATGLSGSKGDAGGRQYELQNLTIDNGVAPIRPVFGYHGFHIDTGYTWEQWGIVALGFAMLTSGDTADGELVTDGEGQPASLSNFLRLELKPLQLTYRHAYKNLMPSIQAGLGVALTTFDAETDVASVELSRSDLFWHFSIEASYYFASWWFGFAGLGVQRELSHDDSDTQLLMTVGAGLTFDNPADVFAPADLPPKEY
jgi:hypothetical protein